MSTAKENDTPDDLARLLAHKPYLRAYFAAPARSESAQDAAFRLEEARDDSRIPTLVTGDRRQRLASAYNPGQEAERTLPENRDTWKGTEIVLILGLGNPYVPLRLLPALAPGQIVLAVDAFFELGVLLCREHPDFRAYLARPGSHLFCGEAMLEPLWTYLDGLTGEGLAGLKIVSHRASRGVAPEFYEGVEERVKTLIKSKMSDLLTRFEFEKNWIRNIIVNSERLPAIDADRSGDAGPDAMAATQAVRPDLAAPPHGVRRWEGVLAGRPALLVSAGPSLRHSIEGIRKLKERAFVLACDTAFKILRRAGITPHGVICLDAQKHSLLHFLGEDLSETLFFCDVVIHPSILRQVRSRAVIFSTTAKHVTTADGRPVREATPGTEHAESIFGPIGDIQSGGSVATTAFDLLRILGAGKILLIGQDLAYTGRQIHCTGTHHNERWLPKLSRLLNLETINETVVRRRHTHPEVGIGGRTVVADYVLNLYRSWFEDAIPRAGVPTYNLSAGGVHIESAVESTPQAIWNELPPSQSPNEFLKLFADARPLENHAHEANRTLFADLERALAANDAAAFEDLFARHEFLRPLTRRAETYVKRNREKLSDERAGDVHARFVKRELDGLLRGLRPYFGGTTRS